MQLTAKPTRYRNTLFRSRLEVRWAILLDQLGIKWLYEPRCFSVCHGGYLPDFYLPKLKMWAEVKPGPLDSTALTKIMDVAAQTGENALLFEGNPSKLVRMVYPCNDMQALDAYKGLVIGPFTLGVQT